jgi:hypothetical protein
MTHHCNNIDIYTHFVAQILDFRQSAYNPEGIHRALRIEKTRNDGGKAGELNRHGAPGNRPSLAL